MQNLIKRFLLMVLVLVAHVLFPEAARPTGKPRPAFAVRKVVSVKVEDSWRNLTGTATVQLPGRWLFKERDLAIKEWLRRGDPIEIWLGYNRQLEREFTGYVTDVKPGIPVTISCEDEMYRLKRHPVKFSSGGVRLPALLRAICPAGTRIDALDTDLGHFKASNVTVAKVLEKLKEQYGFVSYFRDGVLYCGKVYRQGTAAPKTNFSFQRTGLTAVLDDRLEYRTNDDLHVIVKATSHQLHGRNLVVSVGDTTALDAEERTLNYFNLKSEADLRATATRDVQKLKVEGYKGSFTTYGLPSVRHGELVALRSNEYPERDGDFFIDATSKTFEAGGYRQEITLGSASTLYGLQS
ncbi:hypothetical protein SAMN02745146_0100 [Hymenobacter daecheongensis DSM 21074]|uniref:Phage protein D n=1 Tax=Hymenobacter daecheongensis DSM 21074 TaxID=1121955 RepID=A0A1M6LYB7_9BACT|nr:hypothetical protein [Hymenobacter daecheongensis]SHJ76155.1 hypothetical protein SAMN02745146_0100 [Hymenobacter daecheongensis DSM 21074]